MTPRGKKEGKEREGSLNFFRKRETGFLWKARTAGAAGGGDRIEGKERALTGGGHEFSF